MSAAMENEANAFAMELLMPFDWIVQDAVGIDLTNDAAVAKLAKRYQVPAVTMAVRIGEIRRELESATILKAVQSATQSTRGIANGDEPKTLRAKDSSQ